MRILTVVHDLGRGGTQRAAQNFAISYRRLGYESGVLAINTSGSREAALDDCDVRVFNANGNPETCEKLADTFEPDLIHIHRPGRENTLETQLLRRLRKPNRRVLETNIFARVDYSYGADLIDVHLQ